MQSCAGLKGDEEKSIRGGQVSRSPEEYADEIRVCSLSGIFHIPFLPSKEKKKTLSPVVVVVVVACLVATHRIR